MIGKKINQLATELAPTTTDLTIIGDPVTGVSKKITLEQLGAIFGGAVSFYTTLGDFPVTGVIDIIYCAKDTKKLYLWSGSAYVEVFPSQALLNTYQLRSEKGVSNGYASLDVNGKVPIGQLPNSIMEYKGTWNAATNTPTLANGTGDTGDVYICNAAGTVNFGAGPITFAVGDYVVYSGTIWQRSSGAVGTVTSVGLSITGDSIGVTGSPITTSGTLALAFAGNSTQYINGAGNLVTFPGVINEAQNLITEVYNKTGATLTKGTVVYINGGQGNLPSVTKALATGDSTSAQTYGIVRNDITNNNNGYVVVAGRISDLDTQAYTEGTQLYLSPTTAGTYTSTKPYAPNHLVYVGIVVRAHPTQGVIEVKIQNGYELDELHNVSAQSPTNNDGIFYNSATSLWEKKSIATVLGYTPQAQLNGTGFVKASGTTISYDNSTYVTTDTFQTISASKTFSVGLSLASAGGTNQLTSFINTSSLFSGSAGSNVLGFNSANNIYFGKGSDNGGVIQWTNSAVRYYTLPDATGTIALVGGSGVGTVTSVGLSSATSGVTIGSTPITTSGNITLAIATASGSQQGLLSSTDWTTFNNKQSALTNPVTGTGTTNYLPKFTGTSTIGNSLVFDNGTNVGVNTATPNDYIDGESGMAILRATNGRAVLSLVGTRTDAGETLGRISFTNTNSTNAGAKRLAYISGTRGTTNNSAYLEFAVANDTLGAVAMTLSQTGNLGLGVTPSAWSGVTALQVVAACLYSNTATSGMFLSANAFFDGTADRYINTKQATRYYQLEGNHVWNIAPSGTAGNAISYTQAMTLNASGNLSIGNTNDSYKLDVSGTGRFSASQVDILLNASSTSQYSRLVYLENGAEKGGVQYINSAFSTTARRNKLEIFNSGGIAFITQGAFASPDLLIASTGAATFSSSVTAGDVSYFKKASGAAQQQIRLQSTTNSYATEWAFGNTPNSLNLSAAYFNGTSWSSDFFTITTGGNVLIGTTTNTYSSKLVVIGSGNGFLELGQATSSTLFQSNGQDFYLNLKGTGNIVFRNGSGDTERMRITSGGNVEIATGSIKTGEPDTGWGRAAIKIGASVSGAAFNVTRYLPVNVDGTVYYINLNSSTP